MKRFANWMAVFLLLAWMTAMPITVYAEEVQSSPPQSESGAPSEEGGAEPAPDPGANDVSVDVPTG